MDFNTVWYMGHMQRIGRQVAGLYQSRITTTLHKTQIEFNWFLNKRLKSKVN
jgi:hypothetical protein